MADPASILGLIAASLTIMIRAATIGKDMHVIIAKYRTTDKKVKQLSVHVAAVRIAARSLSSWLEDDAVGSEEVEDVKGELFEVLTACSSLLLDLQEHVARALSGAENVGFKSAVHYIWDEDIIKETTETLHHQETVLILMLQALERLSRREQRAKLEERAVRQTLTMAKRPSSSIFGVRSEARDSTRFSYATETSEKIDAVFTFDMEVMGSLAYRNAFTSLFRRDLPTRHDISRHLVQDSAPTVTIVPLDSVSEEGVLHPAAGSPGGSAEPTSQSAKPVSSTRHDYRTSERQSVIVVPHIHGQSPDKYKSFHHYESKVLRQEENRSATLANYAEPPAGFDCRALYDYEPDQNDRHELSFRANDIIRVLRMLDSGWGNGILHGVCGWFPSNYCVMLPESLPGHIDDPDASNDEEVHSTISATKDTRTQGKLGIWIPKNTPDEHLTYSNLLTGLSATDLPEDANIDRKAQSRETFVNEKLSNSKAWAVPMTKDGKGSSTWPHKCAKGERCVKWRKQQREFNRLQQRGDLASEGIDLACMEPAEEEVISGAVPAWISSLAWMQRDGRYNSALPIDL
jgi:hypothetical protein